MYLFGVLRVKHYWRLHSDALRKEHIYWSSVINYREHCTIHNVTLSTAPTI
jgi:hypothetical protein